MKSSEICQLAIEIVAWQYGQVKYRNGYNTSYGSPHEYWNGLTWWDSDQCWHADCLGFLRAVLCGWNGTNKQSLCDGADQTYGCYTTGGDHWWFIDSCSVTNGGGGTFTDFSQLVNHPCSLLYKNTPFQHVGIYVGEFQLGGQTYNTCECTTSYGTDTEYGGGKPAWVDPDGTRRPYKGASSSAGMWLGWGIFNTGGTDYGLTEYDGGAIPGATGFGTALSQAEAEMYFPQVFDQDWLTYDYLEGLANTLYGMDARYFQAYAGYVFGENPEWFDDYMLYLDSSICVNRYMGYGLTTVEQLSPALAGGDHSGYYDVSSLLTRGQQLHDNPDMTKSKRARAGILLALLNPQQECIGCHGVPPKPAANLIIYTQYDVMNYSGIPDPEIWAIRDSTLYDYPTTGTGIRGGWTPFPVRKMTRILTRLKPIQMRNWYRLAILRH